MTKIKLSVLWFQVDFKFFNNQIIDLRKLKSYLTSESSLKVI